MFFSGTNIRIILSIMPLIIKEDILVKVFASFDIKYLKYSDGAASGRYSFHRPVLVLVDR